jgi:hypothetical protein
VFYEVWADDFQWMLFALVIACLPHVELREAAELSWPRLAPLRARSLR